jgi:hypothetical protein
MDPLTTNPFSVLTFIAAPAILTNAASVMGLMTSNRIARVVDRTRQLTTQLEKSGGSDPDLPVRLRELEASGRRSHLLIRALTAFYLAVGSFAAASLVSLVGMVLLLSGYTMLTKAVIGIGLVCGTVALGGLIGGAALLVWETRLALAILRETTEWSCRQLKIGKMSETPIRSLTETDTVQPPSVMPGES